MLTADVALVGRSVLALMWDTMADLRPVIPGCAAAIARTRHSLRAIFS